MTARVEPQMGMAFEFDVLLPPQWTAVSGDELRAAAEREPDSPLPALLARTRAAMLDDSVRPEMLAYFSHRVLDDDGTALGLVVATLVVSVFPSGDVDPGAVPGRGAVTDPVEFGAGKSGRFYELLLAVPSTDGQAAAVLTFSSPNLPLAEYLDTGWRRIASTVSLRPVAGAAS